MKNTVVVKAVKRGSRATRIGIIHLDPKGHERARRVEVPRDVAEYLEDQGLGEILKTVTLEAEDAGETLGDRGARIRGENADAEDEHRPPQLGASGADTRDTTAFERDPTIAGRSSRRRAAAEGAERNEELTREAAAERAGSRSGDDADADEDEAAGDADGGDAPADEGGDDAGGGEAGQGGAAAPATRAARPAPTPAAAARPTSARARAATASRDK